MIAIVKMHQVILRGLGFFAAATALIAVGGAQTALINPATMPRVGTVDERFQSYNIEMVEVTGGRFWKPYASTAATAQPTGNQPAGMDASLYEYRPPINLANLPLRKLAAALGPAYLRVSGTWQNSTYFQGEGESATEAPAGFKGVLTRAEWKGVVEFARAADARLVTSFAVSAGARDAQGVWQPQQAERLVDFTHSLGGSIAAAEFMNEPTFPEMGGAPKGYDAQAFARDFAVFRAFARAHEPRMLLLGPGGVGEGSSLLPASMKIVSSDSLFAATGPVFDAVSYHSYGAVSTRCAALGSDSGTTAQAALSEQWLARAAKIEEFYGKLRDRYEPGKPLWNTETAQAACGGDRWASTFLDSFRYLNQLGALARRGVQVNMHNTLASSDYGLLDEKTYEPRPDYWAALLWRRLMGGVVLDPGASTAANVHVYAHCLRNHAGGVALLAINADASNAAAIELPTASEAYTLTAQTLQSAHVELNGTELALGAEDALPPLRGAPTQAGKITLKPASISFFAIDQAKNVACR